MVDSYNDPQQNGRHFDNSRNGGRGGFRGGRNTGNREGGGFRIRLSENEMRSARIIQEAFNLRSTVAVLGFAVRTLAEMLEQGKLDEFVNEYRAQGPRGHNQRQQNPRNNSFDDQKEASSTAVKANPFARPAKPESPSEENQEDSSKKEETLTSENQTEEEKTPTEES